jgi:hypothetical protein
MPVRNGSSAGRAFRHPRADHPRRHIGSQQCRGRMVARVPQEKAQFFAIAQGSLSELHTQLLLCERLGWVAAESLQPAYRLIDEVSRMLTVLRRKLRAPSGETGRR